MALNGIEEFVGEYLRIIEKCDFIKYNEKFTVKTEDSHKQKGMSEVDVIGINLKDRTIFVCEVSAQMGGIYGNYPAKLDYRNPNNKFAKNQRYIEEHFKDFNPKTVKHMFWCPILTEKQKEKFILPGEDSDEKELKVELIAGQDFLKKIAELAACLETCQKDYASPVIRFLQVLVHLAKKREKTGNIFKSGLLKLPPFR